MKPWHLASILTAAGHDARPVLFTAILALNGFPVTPSAIEKICRRIGWKHLPPERDDEAEARP